jgi:hypothetical protein
MLQKEPKEILNMRVTRKIQAQVEAKIRHAIATGPLPHIVRGPGMETRERQESNKLEIKDTNESK